jgi:hypothetical protein
MVGKCLSADNPSTLLLSFRLYPLDSDESRPFRNSLRDHGLLARGHRVCVGQLARLHQRPSVRPTETCTPKHADTRSEVTTSHSGPETVNSPSETRPP